MHDKNELNCLMFMTHPVTNTKMAAKSVEANEDEEKIDFAGEQLTKEFIMVKHGLIIMPTAYPTCCIFSQPASNDHTAVKLSTLSKVLQVPKTCMRKRPNMKPPKWPRD